jgi:hypothetical protein
MPKLTIQQPDGNTVKYGLNGTSFSVGRATDNDIVLVEGGASSRHAVLEVMDNGAWTVKDLNSTNHTRINGNVVQTAILNHGDNVQFGSINAIYEEDRSPIIDSQATQIYEQHQPVAAAKPRAAGPPQLRPNVIQRPVSTMPRRTGGGARSSGDGCFGLMVLGFLLPAVFVLGLIIRHKQETGGWFWIYARDYFAGPPEVTIEVQDPTKVK